MPNNTVLRFARVLSVASVLALCITPRAHAASTLTDPTGDYVSASSCNGQICEPWQDIISAEMTHIGSGLRMTMTVLSTVPAQPVLPPGIKFVVWAWRLNTDPNANPAGFPLPDGIDSPFEVIVDLKWDGKAFSGEVIDRRPLLTGGEAIVTPTQVVASGATITADVPASVVSLPTSFQWRATTNAFNGKEGSQGQYPIDNTIFVHLNAGD